MIYHYGILLINTVVPCQHATRHENISTLLVSLLRDVPFSLHSRHEFCLVWPAKESERAVLGDRQATHRSVHFVGINDYELRGFHFVGPEDAANGEW